MPDFGDLAQLGSSFPQVGSRATPYPPPPFLRQNKNMHLEAWISVASVASAPVTLVAAGVAGWQAREARRQAKAAEDQVQEARRSAAAAEEQVELMRRQYEGNEAERRNREKDQATRVTIGVSDSLPMVKIINSSEQQVRGLRIESIGEPRPLVRWGNPGARIRHGWRGVRGWRQVRGKRGVRAPAARVGQRTISVLRRSWPNRLPVTSSTRGSSLTM